MTQEHKELLLKDLSARLPYRVVGKCEIDASYDTSFYTIFQTHKFNAVVYGIKEDLLFVTSLIEDEDEQNFAEEEVADGVAILDFTQYLLPMSSMTEEEFIKLKEYNGLKYVQLDLDSFQNGVYKCLDFYLSEVPSGTIIKIRVFDWLNKYHFDYRDLIQMSLAIAVTKENNPYKE